jgi:hypothetical protein
MNQEELMKNLAVLIDESLAEIEELKKSDRFSASEIKLGDSEGLAGRDKNGKLGKEEEAEKADDDDEDDEGDDKEDKDDDKKDDKAEKAEDMDKGEGKNSEADPNAGKHKVAKADDMDKGEGKNSEADPNAGKHKAAGGLAKSADEDFEGKLKKSQDEVSSLMKSYIDERISPIEGKLEAIATLIKEIADAPVPSRGASYKSLAPLKKSEEGTTEALNKSEVVNKLFELKKSGQKVDSVDIASAELGSAGDLAKIVTKYNIK